MISKIVAQGKVNSMLIALHKAYFVAKEERPFSNYGQLVLLLRTNGLHIDEQHVTGKACRNFMRGIAKTFKSNLRAFMDKSPLLSLMVDSSSDVSVREHCYLFDRFIDPNTHTAHSCSLKMAFMTGTTAKDY